MGRDLEHFRLTCCLLEIEQDGVFLRKTPLGIQPSVKTRIENAVASFMEGRWHSGNDVVLNLFEPLDRQNE
jgi:hypothetical protein